ncbi:hypothetical protein Tco_0115700 [Tanacetum coccineum]
MMRSGVAVVLLPPCRLGLGRIRQAQFKDTQFQAQFKAFEALTLSRRRAIYLVATGSATLGSPYGATHRSLRSSESHCSGPIIPMSEVEQLRSRWSRLDPRMSPLSSLGVVTDALLSQDTLPEASSIHIDFGFSAPYFDLPFLRSGIPNKSLTPRIQWDFTPGESFTGTRLGDLALYREGRGKHGETIVTSELKDGKQILFFRFCIAEEMRYAIISPKELRP